MSTAIKIEGLGKQYVLNGTRSHGSTGYVALRDVLTDGAKRMGKGLMKPATLFSQAHKDEFWALKDINLEIEQGDKVAIIGHNGAGKSTLLKVLSQITQPTKGRVELYGRVASLLEVGTGFHPELTGRENIYLNGSILGMSHTEVRRKFDEIVDFADVERFLDTPVKRYSSGMRMRLGFAVAAHLESEILIIDEVLAVGDAAFQKKCMGKMDEVSKADGRTILFVSHNMGAVQQLCTSGVVLSRGHVMFQGGINDAIHHYGELTSSAPTMNFENRVGNGALRLKDMRLRVDGVESVEAIPGRELEIVLDVESQQWPDGVMVDFDIISLAGMQMTRLGNHFTSGKPIAKGSERIVCRIPVLPLPSGHYSCNIRFAQKNSKLVFDYVQNVPFSVSGAGFFGAYDFESSRQGMMIRHDWTYE